MNKPRKIAALKRNIEHRKAELDRVEELKKSDEHRAEVKFFLEFQPDYVARLDAEIRAIEAEVRELEESDDLPLGQKR